VSRLSFDYPSSVVCAGELLIDCWPSGSEQPGGAPANVACHARALGVPSVLIARLGADKHADTLGRWLLQCGVNADLCQSDRDYPSGTVQVGVSSAGSPVYDILTPAAWDFLEVTERALAAAKQASVFVFGTLSQRHPVARHSIRTLVEAACAAGVCVLADLNLREPYYDGEIVFWTLRHCAVLKLNREELGVVSRMLGASGTDKDLFTGLLREFGIDRGVLTAGGDGEWTFEEGTLTHEPAVPGIEVVDTVGAGDAFCAALAVGLASGNNLRTSAPRAARAAAFVVSQQGATPRLPSGV
jgi:fructokinase